MNLKNLKAALDGENVDISDEINILNEVLEKSFNLNKIEFKNEPSEFIVESENRVSKTNQTILTDEVLKTYKKEDQLLELLSKMITFVEQIDETIIELNNLKVKIESELSEELMVVDERFKDAFETIKTKYCNFGL